MSVLIRVVFVRVSSMMRRVLRLGIGGYLATARARPRL